MNAKEIATTILYQLGGNRFIAMTGAKQFYAVENGGLCFKIGRNKSKCNYIRITLNGKDLYDMEFIKTTLDEVITIKEYKDIYCDQLQELFTEATGLYTHL